ncbi:MAG: hypothetical protein ABIX01_20860 [Chitinophagaceae bacterium]
MATKDDEALRGVEAVLESPSTPKNTQLFLPSVSWFVEHVRCISHQCYY